MKNFYAETKITAQYAQDMRAVHLPDRINGIKYAVAQGLISKKQGEHMIRAEKQWDTRFKQWLAGRRS
jgi:hypothetical protein